LCRERREKFASLGAKTKSGPIGTHLDMIGSGCESGERVLLEWYVSLVPIDNSVFLAMRKRFGEVE
jgi:hypothetical protein